MKKVHVSQYDQTMHVSASRKTAISENNATLEDLKSAQDEVLPTTQGKMAMVSAKQDP